MSSIDESISREQPDPNAQYESTPRKALTLANMSDRSLETGAPLSEWEASPPSSPRFQPRHHTSAPSLIPLPEPSEAKNHSQGSSFRKAKKIWNTITKT
jgi:hypothetical protein